MGWFRSNEEKEDGFVVFFPDSKKFLYDLVTGEVTRQVKRAWFFTQREDAMPYANYYGGEVYAATKTVLRTELGEVVA